MVLVCVNLGGLYGYLLFDFYVCDFEMCVCMMLLLDLCKLLEWQVVNFEQVCVLIEQGRKWGGFVDLFDIVVVMGVCWQLEVCEEYDVCVWIEWIIVLVVLFGGCYDGLGIEVGQCFMVDKIQGLVMCLFEGVYGFFNEDFDVVLVLVVFFKEDGLMVIVF